MSNPAGAMPQFEDLLKQTMGLDAASIGSSVIERAVRERQAACTEPDALAYWERVRASESELQQLIEAVVVPETWFFRHREAYGALTGVALREWLHAHPQGVYRLLSLPCSTGEEPYSIAMALLDAGIAPERFHIDAIDISERALGEAARGVYGSNSFRGADLAFRDVHFVEAPPEGLARAWRISDAVRQRVQFRAGNLFALGSSEQYDVIFCRNMLIYFDRATQDRAVKELGQMLAPQGFMFVGPSETALVSSHGFVSAKVPLAFAFRQPEPAASAAAPRAVPTGRRPAPGPSVRPAPRAVVKPAARARPAAPTEIDMEQIARLADQGHLAEAARQCEAYLKLNGPSAQAYYLLGLVRDGAGNHPEAAGYYRKALYLDPHHPAALAHLALLLERLGDAAGAQLMRQRAQRGGAARGGAP